VYALGALGGALTCAAHIGALSQRFPVSQQLPALKVGTGDG
jgi:hypothetical protein